MTSGSDEEINVLLSEKALVTGSEVHLGDIAAIKTTNEDLLSKLGKIRICPSPKPGFSQTLNAGYVKSQVSQRWPTAQSINWGGFQQTVVETKAIRLSPLEFLSEAEKFVRSKCSVQDQEPSIMVRSVGEIRPAVLPRGKVSIKVESMVPVENGLFRSSNGIVSLRFTVSVDGCILETRVMQFRVSVFREVITAGRTLNRDEIIGGNDLRMAVHDVAKSPSYASAFSGMSELIGKRSKRIIAEGVVIVADMVEIPPVIECGEFITIVIESSAFRITARGKAMEDGAYGQVIRVANTLSMKIIEAQVVKRKLVKVAF